MKKSKANRLHIEFDGNFCYGRLPEGWTYHPDPDHFDLARDPQGRPYYITKDKLYPQRRSRQVRGSLKKGDPYIDTRNHYAVQLRRWVALAENPCPHCGYHETMVFTAAPEGSVEDGDAVKCPYCNETAQITLYLHPADDEIQPYIHYDNEPSDQTSTIR